MPALTDTSFTLSQTLRRGKNSLDNYFLQRSTKQSLEETWVKCCDTAWDGRDYSLIVFITTEIAQSGHTSNLFIRYLEFEGQIQALFFKLFLCTNIS